jgi:pyruvate ferredoxin oxidoreductase beta subunit
MDSLSVVDPKKLPLQERFLSGRRSCKGCAKSLAARLVSKVSGIAEPALDEINNLAGFPNSALSANTFSHDRVNTSDTLEKLVSIIDSFNAKSSKQSQTAHSEVKKPVIGIDRKVLDSDYLVLQRVLKNKHALIVCFDNEPALDTLISRAIPRPFIQNEKIHPVTEKDVRDAVRNKNIPPVVANEDFAYVATACPSYPYDLIDKVQHGQDSSGNAFILVMTPCPTGWMFAPDKTLEIGRQAVLTGYFPLFEVDGGKIQLTVQPKNRKPIQEYLAMQKRFLTFPESLMPVFQEAVDEFYEDIQKKGTIHEIAKKKINKTGEGY